MALILTEAAIPSVLGAAIGLLLELGASPSGRMCSHQLGNIPAPSISPFMIALAVLFALLSASACALIPTLRLKRMDLVSALAGR
jgi:ABC-type antimicrobial peptide transport system permease subunit